MERDDEATQEQEEGMAEQHNQEEGDYVEEQNNSFSAPLADDGSSSMVATDQEEEAAAAAISPRALAGHHHETAGMIDFALFSSTRMVGGRGYDDAEAKQKAVQGLLRARLAEGDHEFSLAVSKIENSGVWRAYQPCSSDLEASMP
jgi:hypothetical protein